MPILSLHTPSQRSYKKALGLSHFRRAVYAVVAQIRPGQFRTYGEVARLAGVPKAARAVGTALRENCYQDVPCHRVVRSDGAVGEYAFGGTSVKVQRLMREGITLVRNRVVFPKK